MTDGSDPSALQSWMIAIPSLITAASTWYMSRKTTKVGSAATANTTKVVEQKSDETRDEVLDLKKRVTTLEAAVHQARDSQLIIAQKYTETMDRLHCQIGDARAVLQKAMIPSVPNDVSAGSAKETPAGEHGKVTVKDVPPQPTGKVILKP